MGTSNGSLLERRRMALKSDTGGFRVDRGGTFSAASSYTPQGVNFDGLTSLLNAAIASGADGPGFLVTGWVKPDTINSFLNLFVVDPTGTYIPYVDLSAPGGSPFLFCAPFNDFFANYPTVTAGSWQFIALACKTDVSAGNKLIKLAVGNTVIPPTAVTDTAASGNVPLNGLAFQVGDDGSGGTNSYVGGLCDFQYRVGDFFVAGDIPTATLRNFITADGKPVGPAVAAANLGAASVCLSVSSTAASFATNTLGAGGSFSIVGGPLTLIAGPT